MDNKTTTILFIRYDDNDVKSLNIRTHFVKFYKRYLFAFGTLILLSITGLIVLFSYIKGINSENSGLTSQLFTIHKKVELIDSLKLKQKLEQIKTNLDQIHSYLQSRGMIQSNISAGGEPSSSHESDYYKVEAFEEQSVIFLNRVEKTPLGVPHEGPISSEYGYRYNPFGGHGSEFHPGIDFKGEIGDSVFATAEGVVERSDWYGGYGNAVEIYHTNGISTLYGHLSRVCVANGQKVKAGELIGFIGTTGRSTGPHVHYEIRKNEVDIDPNPYLKLN